MLPCNSERIECRQMSGLAPHFHIKLCANAPDEFRRPAFRGKHPRQKKQISRLYGFRIRAKRLRRRWKLDAELSETFFSGRRDGGHGEHSFSLPVAEMSATVDIESM